MSDVQKSGKFILNNPNEKDGSVLKGRDVEFELRGVDIHPTIKSLLIRLAEINYVNVKAIAEMGTMIEQMSDIIVQFIQVADNMKTEAEALKKMHGGGVADVADDVSTN